jgi:hypothetical protein
MCVSRYEAHLHSEEGWDFVGGVFPGCPIPLSGHNRQVTNDTHNTTRRHIDDSQLFLSLFLELVRSARVGAHRKQP